MILQLIMDNLDKVIEYGILLILILVFKNKPNAKIISAVKGVSTSIQELVLEIMAQASADHEKVNSKLKVPVKLDVITDLNMQRHEVVKQALIEKNDSKLDKIANKVGGYDNLIKICYNSAKWLLKALKGKR